MLELTDHSTDVKSLLKGLGEYFTNILSFSYVFLKYM